MTDKKKALIETICDVYDFPYPEVRPDADEDEITEAYEKLLDTYEFKA